MSALLKYQQKSQGDTFLMFTLYSLYGL